MELGLVPKSKSEMEEKGTAEKNWLHRIKFTKFNYVTEQFH